MWQKKRAYPSAHTILYEYKFTAPDTESFLPAACPRRGVSENTNREFVIRTDFLPYILRIPTLGYLLPGTSTGTRGLVPLAWDPSNRKFSFSLASNYGIIGTTHQDIKSRWSSHSRHGARRFVLLDLTAISAQRRISRN